MQKDHTYHEAAITYNAGLAEAAEALANKIEHPVIKKWCSSVGRQHRFHEERHHQALARMNEREHDEKVDEAKEAVNNVTIVVNEADPELTPAQIQQMNAQRLMASAMKEGN